MTTDNMNNITTCENNRKIRIANAGAKRITTLMLSPAIIIVFLVVAVPMLYSLLLSFTNFSLLNANNLEFTGLKNYVELLKDPVFLNSFIRTIAFLLLSISLEFIIGFSIAILFSRYYGRQGILRTLMVTPMMFAPVMIGFQFKWFFNDQTGLINNLIYTITRSDHGIAWLIEPGLGFLSIMAAEVWMSTPFMVLVLLAGLLSLPKELFEAATVDGASEGQNFRYLTLPLMGPFIYISLAIRFLDISRTYDIVRIMTDGGPANRTELVWTYVFRLGITSNKFSMGCAMSFITVAISLIFTLFLFKQFSNTIEG